MDPVNDLKNLINGGLVEDIRQIEESLALQQQILSQADRINKAEFGPLFGRLQLILGRCAVTTAIRLFEPPDDNYPSRSIPTILNHMRFTADYLNIVDRNVIIERLIGFGHEQQQFEGIPDPWITQLIRKEFHDHLPAGGDAAANELSQSLDTLNRLKDKFIDHCEVAQSDNEWKSCEQHIRLLLEYATDFVMTIGKGYLNQDYLLDGNISIFGLDTDRTTETMKKLLGKIDD